tara:strand:- start:181 stop:783 length:603 start_codon:yes stop_codon:yes gene_type:complete
MHQSPIKKALYVFIFLAIANNINAQTSTQKASVEKSLYGIQTGFLGIWGHNEARLTNTIALRTEIGLDADIFNAEFIGSNDKFLLTPVITLEPRWYYSLNRRFRKGKKIVNNTANFLTLKISYHPNLFVISNVENIEVIPDLQIIPKWAIKRTVGKHFTYETGIDIGYRKLFYPNDRNRIFIGDDSDVAVDLHLRLGYTF